MVMTVSPDGTVVPKPVETGDLRGGLRVIRAGLAPGGPRDHRRADAAQSRRARSRRSMARSTTTRAVRPPRLGREIAMRLSHFFIDRPVFATVLSVFVT